MLEEMAECSNWNYDMHKLNLETMLCVWIYMYNSFIEKSFYENLLKSSELSSSSCETQQQCRYVSILYSKYHKNIIKVLAVHVKHVPSLLLCSLIVQNYKIAV